MLMMMKMICVVFGSMERDQQKSVFIHLCLISKRNRLSVFQNPRFAMEMSLKNLLRLKKQAKGELDLEALDHIPMEEFDQMTMKTGKHQGLTYKETYEVEDGEYMAWIVGHCKEENTRNQEMKAFLKYIRRRLQKEIESAGLPLTSCALNMMNDEKPTTEGPKPKAKAKLPEGTEMMQQSEMRMCMLEGNLSTMHQRLQQMESTMTEMMYFLKSQQQMNAEKSEAAQ